MSCLTGISQKYHELSSASGLGNYALLFAPELLCTKAESPRAILATIARVSAFIFSSGIAIAGMVMMLAGVPTIAVGGPALIIAGAVLTGLGLLFSLYFTIGAPLSIYHAFNPAI